MESRCLLVFVLLLVMVGHHKSSANIPQLNCGDFNPAKIKLVTFDVFAALMDIFTSIETNVVNLCPSLSASQAKTLAIEMVTRYGKFNNHVFSMAETKGQEPFVFVQNSSLTSIITSMRLQDQIPIGGDLFQQIMQSWGNLIPWGGTAATLEILSKHFEIAPLSNGDADTLARATSIFAPSVNMSYIFSSNFPVGAFKPQPTMYNQLLNLTSFAPEEILHVAGAPGDGQGARVFGLYSALLYNKPLPDDLPCFMLSNITTLPYILLPHLYEQ